jgi:protein phosphatase
LVVLIGPAGCGKSRFAAKHFLPTETVSSDDCRARVSDDPSNQQVSGHAFDLMHFIIDKRLRLGRLTVADATNLTQEARRPLVRAAVKFGFNTAAVIFRIPLDACLARNAQRPRVVPEHALLEQYALLEAAVRSIHREGFTRVFTLDEAGERGATVEVARRISPQLARQVRL